jgi:hypothetical protein
VPETVGMEEEMKYYIILFAVLLAGCCSTQECRDKWRNAGLIMSSGAQQFGNSVSANARQQQQDDQANWNSYYTRQTYYNSQRQANSPSNYNYGRKAPTMKANSGVIWSND